MPTFPEPKPGWRTSEFWIALVAQVLGILVLFDVVGPQESESLQGTIAGAIENVAALATQVTVLWQYVRSRTQVKLASNRDAIR